MTKRRYRLDFVTAGRKESSFHATRHNAMQAAYDRLDMEQRDAIAMGDAQHKVDAIGRERGDMASSWQAAVRGRDRLVYAGARLSITRCSPLVRS